MTQNEKHHLLIVGLGNPDKAYEETPHNLGRFCVSRYAEALGFSDFTAEKKFNALVSSGLLHEQRIMAQLPETFMNNSGQAVLAISHFYNISPTHIWIVHDDIDLPLGSVRVAFGGGSAGHHGVESISQKLGEAHFWRFRIGIAPEKALEIPLDAYVLKKGVIDAKATENIISRTAYLLTLALEKGIEEAQKQSD
ncbi:MAG: aminoacyl-tRNA hydrolase [bacterium]|nr:aminoacyl-tRNA hydrolase [bacterium]